MKKYVYTLLFAFSSLFIAEAQQLFDLKRCIETGLEQNYSIRIIRNEQQISDNNATPGNAGYLPTVDMSGGFSGNINNNRNSLQDGSIEKANGINSETGNVGLNVNWTVFDGFGIQAEYSRLKELQRMGELNTRMTIEDFVANLSSEYYNLIGRKSVCVTSVPPWIFPRSVYGSWKNGIISAPCPVWTCNRLKWTSTRIAPRY